MIKVQNKVDCCGCNACGDICPKDAISFKTDHEGFWYPEVDMNRCIDCHLCEKTCPIINAKELKKNDLPQSICYAAEHKNLEVVFDSTSGGLFSALADIMYRDNGFVGGAIFNEDFKSVRQYISNDKNDLPKIRSSKYLQSNLEGFFKIVKDLVKTNEKVLVCGSPCQMAALRAFLKKDYENLIIVDYICRGINSPKVWSKYIDSFEERYGHKVIYAKAKSKEYGWRNLTQKVVLDNGKTYFETKHQSNFTIGYLRTGVYCRPSCYDCKFKGYPRIADITLADFWGIEKVDKTLEKNLGTSLVMINSQKGEHFFERVKSRINYISVPFNSIEAGNRSLNLSLEQPKVNRKEFFKDLETMTFTELSAKYLKKPTVEKSTFYKIRKKIGYFRNLVRKAGNTPAAIFRLLKYNTLKELWNGNVLIICPNCIVHIDKDAKITKHGISYFGYRFKFKKSKLESRLYVGKNSTLNLCGSIILGYGSDVEIFDNATLNLSDGVASNIGTCIICSNSITLDKNVKIGRNVTIRDNNGGHYLNRPGYKDSKPIIIGEKVWLCEECTIMPGVKIGDGGIVGARSLAVSHIPANCMVSGNPAVIVDKEILWKY